MSNIKELQNGLAKVKKHLSLRQVAIQSGMNYITLRNIMTGKTERVTDKVAEQLRRFVAAFDPLTAKPLLKKRGRKPGAQKAIAPGAAPKAPAKNAAVLPAGKGAPAVKSAAPVKAAAPVATPAQPKRRRKPGRKPGRKPQVAVTAAPVEYSPAPLGSKLREEISMVEARLNYLKTLERAEATYFAAIRKK